MRELLSTKKSCSAAVRLAPTTITHSKALKIVCLAHTPSEWHTYTIHVSIVSRLTNPYLTSSPSSTLIEVDLTSDINKGS